MKKPWLVLLSSILIPVSGHVILGMTNRGLRFLFPMVILAWVGHKLFPEFSFIFKNGGLIFFWGLAALDAYKIAKIRAMESLPGSKKIEEI